LVPPSDIKSALEEAVAFCIGRATDAPALL
jgi:hypothetical protein